MKYIYLLLFLAFLGTTAKAQWTQTTNPDNVQLGVGGVAVFNDTLYTGTAITAGFSGDPQSLYKSTEGEVDWALANPASGLRNEDIDFYHVTATDSFLVVAARRQVQFSKDGLNWELQSAISNGGDENIPLYYLQLGNTLIAGARGSTNNGGDGVFKKIGSDDWVSAGEGLPAGADEDFVSINAMAQINGRILAATLEGLYASDDTAATWSLMLNQNLTQVAAGNEIIFASTYRSGRAYMYKSTDDGETFSELDVPEYFTDGIIGLTFTGSYFYASVQTYDEDGGGVYRSEDGENWAFIGLGGKSIRNITATSEYLYAYASNSYPDDAEEGLHFISLSDIVATSNEAAHKPVAFSLQQNYPNPFNPSTMISYTLDQTAEVNLRVFNMLGQEAAVLDKGMKSAGNHTIQFDATNLPSGVYIYQLSANGATETRRMMLIK